MLNDRKQKELEQKRVAQLFNRNMTFLKTTYVPIHNFVLRGDEKGVSMERENFCSQYVFDPKLYMLHRYHIQKKNGNRIKLESINVRYIKSMEYSHTLPYMNENGTMRTEVL
jgi:hypothetical protein